MVQHILTGLAGLLKGSIYLFSMNGLPNLVMLGVAGVLIWLAIKHDVEPLLLLPIGFGCLLVNLPMSEVMKTGGVLKVFYDAGITTEIFPLLIFIGIGAMTDFRPLFKNPSIFLLGAAGQLGIFSTLALALWLGFTQLESVCIGIIGACDGPTSIYFTSQFAPHLLGAVSVAAYSYMSLVPIIQPPIIRALLTKKEREIRMTTIKGGVSKTTLVLFPLVVLAITGLIAPKGLPLMGMICLGNFMRESGVVERLTRASENEIANVVTLLLGLCIGGTMEGHVFLKTATLMILALGFLAIVFDTVFGVLLGKVYSLVSGGKINPMIGAAGLSAYPMCARVVQTVGQKYDKKNFLLMPAMCANTGGQIGSVIAAAIILGIMQGLGMLH
jgi:sodium ion-translocating decarboxylase beta subunit